MTRRWFGKVIGAIAAACGVAQIAPAAVPCKMVSWPKKSWCGYVREGIAQGQQGWVDIPPGQPNAWISAITARAHWSIKAGTRVVVADNYPKECHIFMAAECDGIELTPAWAAQEQRRYDEGANQ